MAVGGGLGGPHVSVEVQASGELLLAQVSEVVDTHFVAAIWVGVMRLDRVVGLTEDLETVLRLCCALKLLRMSGNELCEGCVFGGHVGHVAEKRQTIPEAPNQIRFVQHL